MDKYPEAEKIGQTIKAADKIVVVQADNPDGDSLASSLALEDILSEQNKEVIMYCGVDMPFYLSYLPGSSRVTNEMPKQFDLSVIVDTASDALLEQLDRSGAKNWLASRPCLVIDHHTTAPTIGFASLICNHPAVATGEVIYQLAQQLGWKLTLRAKELISSAILSDSLGLTSEATTARSIHIIGDLVEQGVSLAALENARRETWRRAPELIHYKGRLLQRVEFYENDRIATITIPQDEINEFSPLYNPPMLVLDDMRLTKNTQLVIGFKTYDDGRITAKIRCNFGFGVADKLAEHFGGGGHPYAAGFKLSNGKNIDQIKRETIEVAIKLLNELKDSENATL